MAMDTTPKRANLAAPLWCLVILVMVGCCAVLWSAYRDYSAEMAKAAEESGWGKITKQMDRAIAEEKARKMLGLK